MSSLHELIQTTVEQDLSLEDRRPTVAVVSKSLLSGQSIARKLSLVGVNVFEYRHFDALFENIDLSPPDIVLIDPAGQELEWRALVSLLRIFSERSRVVLLAASMNVDQAVEAANSGVAAIFIKPYKEEEHTERVLGLVNEIQGVAPGRLQPRFTPRPESEIHVYYLTSDDWLAFPMEVRNIGEKGARLCLPYREFAAELQPGSSGFPATLAIGSARISLYLRVVHREGGTIGVLFERIGAGRKVLESFIRDLHTQAFGGSRNRRRW
jgi:DNA-binding NarL/FixJ family response regulator